MNSKVLRDPALSDHYRVKVGKVLGLANIVRAVGTSNGNETMFGRHTFYAKEEC